MASSHRFEIGRRYVRREIHAQYGGQQQGGISTPAGHPFNMLVTGAAGLAYGYSDGWESDGTFKYFGEGTEGDMRFRAGNAAIRDHAARGRELHLFEKEKDGRLAYLGEMTCASYSFEDNVPDVHGTPRRAIAFRLVPTDALDDVSDHEAPGATTAWTESMEDLRDRASATPAVASPRESKRLVFARSAALRIYVLRRADGVCEGCQEPAPFETAAGHPYLEAHHTRRLSDGGPDDPRWVIAICPNCHRRAHYARDAADFNESLKLRLGALEASPASGK